MIAHDTGATVARRLAIIDQRVSALVLIDTEIPNERPPFIEFFQRVLSMRLGAEAFRWLLRSRVFLRSHAGFGGCFVDRSLIDDEFIAAFVQPLIDSRRRLEGQVRYALGIDWAQLDALKEGHRQIQAPVLLIWGERDGFFPIEKARRMAEQYPTCKGLVSISDAKLLPHEEHPALVLGHLLSFLGS